MNIIFNEHHIQRAK